MNVGNGTPTEKITLLNSGNVGIGTTSPNHMLDISGSNPILALNDTDTTNDRFRFTYNGGSGQLQVDPNNVRSGSHLLVAVDGSEHMRIDSSGNIMFGTTSSTVFDDTSGSGVVIRGATGAVDIMRNNDHPLLVNRTGGDGQMIMFHRDGVNKSAIAIRSNSLCFDTPSGTERMRINSSGNVGIGTTSPLTGAQLTVSNSDAPAIAFQRSGSGKFESAIGMATNSSLRFYTGADSGSVSGLSERMQIDSSGKVGIGTTSPGQLLHLKSSAPAIQFEDTGANGSAISVIEDNNGFLKFRCDAGNAGTGSGIGFEVDASERMRIDSSGNLVLGSSTASGAFTVVSTKNAESGRSNAQNYHLHLRNNENDNGEAIGISFGITSSSTGVGASILHERDSSGSQGSLQFYTNGDGSNVSERMRIAADGKVGIGTNSPRCKNEVYDSSISGVFNATDLSTWRVLQVRNNIESNTGTAAGISFGGDGGSDTETAGICGISTNSTGGVVDLAFLTASGNASTERMRIVAAGNVGIGTSNPTGSNAVFGGSQRTLMVAGSAAPMVRIASDTSNQADLLLQAGNSGADAVIANAASNGDLVFSLNDGGTQGTKVRFRHDGGINFGTDNATANALDDYEEGTFSPMTSTEASVYHARYTKIGNLCTINCNFEMKSGQSKDFINLPFEPQDDGAGKNTTSNSTTLNRYAGTCAFFDGGTTVVNLMLFHQGNQGAAAFFLGQTSSGGQQWPKSITESDFGQVSVSFTYQVK